MPTRPKSRRRILFALVLAGVIWLGIEAMAFLAFRAVFDEFYSPSSHAAASARVAADSTGAQQREIYNPGLVIHPYVGYVGDPPSMRRARGGDLPRDPQREHGFLDPEGPIRRRTPGKVLVGITGGSVAATLSIEADSVIRDELSRHAEFAGREIEFVRLALPGYKQPQQLFAIQYALVSGGEFDLVVNIDGFNEVALVWGDHVMRETSPYFPSNWSMYATAPAKEVTLAVGALEYTRAARRTTATTFGTFPLSISPACGLLWRLRDRSFEHRIAQQIEATKAAADSASNFALRGPAAPFDDEHEMFDLLADIWVRGSIELNRVCASHGIEYFHFLQPNQYVEGSKTLSTWERAEAYDESTGYCYAVREGYPRLLEAARTRLRPQGVRFVDLTGVFADATDTLYTDVCCHLNRHANGILGRTVGREIGNALHGTSPLWTRVDSADRDRPSRVRVSPPERALAAPLERVALRAVAVRDDGTEIDASESSPSWSSSSPTVARVDSRGTVTALTPGTTTIRVDFDGVQAETEVTVEFPPAARYGSGSPGTDDHVPTLDVSFRDGDEIEVRIAGALGGAAGHLWIGFRPDDRAWCGGHAYVPAKESIHTPIQLDGASGAAGAGTFHMPLHLDDALRGRTVFVQGFVADEAAGCGWAMTNGLAISVPE